MKKRLLFYTAFFATILSYAQKENNNWAFGYGAGLDFNSGTPVSVSTSMDASEGYAAVSDPATGTLLFYTSGETVWNRNHQPMANGKGLKGNTKELGLGDNTTKQGVCIVPMPGSSSKYYIFSLEPQGSEHLKLSEGHLYYSVVDMSLNGGLGDVDAKQKNILLDSLLAELMIPVAGDRCNDIWLLTHSADTALIKAFHITPEGINTTPVISYTGKDADGVGSYNTGEFAISPDRKRLAISSNSLFYYFVNFLFPPNASPNGVLLTSFDPLTGKVTDPVVLYSNLANKAETFLANSLSFSPDGSKLYLSISSQALGDINLYDTLWQFDLSNYTQNAILASRTFISAGVLDNTFSAMVRYKDKIYIASSDDLNYMSVIESPNLKGTACRYQRNAIQLKTGSTAGLSMPTLVVYPLKSDTAYATRDSAVCSGGAEGIILTGPISESALPYHYRWDNGDTTINRPVYNSGTYWLNYYNTCRFRVDTLDLSISEVEAVIGISGFTLSTNPNYKSYQWMRDGEILSGATQSTYEIDGNGRYVVIVTDKLGCTDTSDGFDVSNYNSINSLADISSRINIYPNPANEIVSIKAPLNVHVVVCSIDGKVIQRERNASAISVKHLAPGMYLLNIYNKDNIILKSEKLVIGR